jgi:hypothetical protein
MKLEDITEIVQTRDQDVVNHLLAKGYKIIRILSTKYTTNEGEFVRPCYILGRCLCGSRGQAQAM